MGKTHIVGLLGVLVVITMLLISWLGLSIVEETAYASQDKGLYYPGRFFVARDLEGQAVIIDLQEATSRKVKLWGSNRPLILPERGWSSTSPAR